MLFTLVISIAVALKPITPCALDSRALTETVTDDKIRAISQTCSVHQAAEYPLRREILLRDLTGSTAVAFIVTLNCIDRPQNILRSSKSKKSAADWQDVTEGGVLSHDRFPRR
jgi:hypothetical protein